jgi:hypothetical protein
MPTEFETPSGRGVPVYVIEKEDEGYATIGPSGVVPGQWGAFATQDIPAHTVIGRYAPGVPPRKFRDTSAMPVHHYGVEVTEHKGKRLKGRWEIDGMLPNGDIVWHWSTMMNDRGSEQLNNAWLLPDGTIETTKPIIKGEEMLLSYGMAYWHNALRAGTKEGVPEGRIQKLLAGDPELLKKYSPQLQALHKGLVKERRRRYNAWMEQTPKRKERRAKINALEITVQKALDNPEDMSAIENLYTFVQGFRFPKAKDFFALYEEKK